MPNTAKTGKVGELLVAAGLLTKQDLKEGIDLSATLGLPIGKTMVMSGVLRERTVRTAVRIQSMLKDGLIERDTAVKALAKADKEGLSVEDTLKSLGHEPITASDVNKVGQLLVDASVVSPAELQEAVDHAKTMGLPLGRVLVLTGRVKGSVVWCALNAQMMLRKKRIDRQKAVNAIKSVFEKQENFEMALRAQGIEHVISEHRIKLGEILVLSGLVGEEDVLGSVEEGVLKEKPLGQVLIAQGLLSNERLEDALKLQGMADNSVVTPLQAVDLLRAIHKRNQSLEQALDELGLTKPSLPESLKLGEILKMCGWLTESEVKEAVDHASKNSNMLGKMLVSFGFIDEAMLFNALRCQHLVKEGLIRRDQAIVALHLSQRKQCTLDNALLELGYTKRDAGSAAEKS